MKTPVKPKLNVRLLRRIQKHIKAEPRRFQMRAWVTRFHGDSPLDPPCGTAGCIGGWAVLLSGGRIREGTNVGARAHKLLGLGQHETDVLFSTYGWPRQFSERYNRVVENPWNFTQSTLAIMESNAAVAIERIDHFIKTRE